MKILTNYDFNKNQLLNVVIQQLATAPATPSKGQIYFNTTSNRMFVFNGSEWIGADAIGATMTGDTIVTALNGSTFLIDDDNLSQGVRDAVAQKHSSHSIAMVTGLQTALDGKVDDSQVLTNVPAGALFTDTVYVHPTTTGNKHVPSGGTTNQILRWSADGTAVWGADTDTIYTLPVASATLGGVKSGTDITVDGSGNVSIVDDSHAHIIANVDGLQTALDDLPTTAEAQGFATTALNSANSYTDNAVAAFIDSAPETLNTLNELAAALGDDPNFATTITNSIALKADKYSVAIGNGVATSIVVTHGLNSRDVVVMLRETASPYAQVITDVEMTSLDTVTAKFAIAPTSNQYTAVIVG